MKDKILTALWPFFALFIFLPPNVFSATTTHKYDGLNRLVQTVHQNGAEEVTVTYSYDGAGNMLSSDVATANPLLGDVDASQRVDLTDALLSLQVTSGKEPTVSIQSAADVDGDGRIGTEEAIFSLQKVSGLR